MTTINGSIKGIANVSKAFQAAGTTTKDMTEVWLVTADFAAYTGAADDAALLTVSALISATARDGRTRVLKWAAPCFSGADANNQAVDFCGGSVAALTISSDSLTGELCTVNTISTEVTATSGTTQGVGILVGVIVT